MVGFISSLLPALAVANTSWMMFPLALVVSLVYSASRFEDAGLIIRRSIRLFVQISVLMVGVFLVLFLLSYNL